MPGELIKAADRLYRREQRLRIEAAQCAAERAQVLLTRLGIVSGELDQIEARIVHDELDASYAEPVTLDELLGQAIKFEAPVTFEYQDRRGDKTLRTVSPYELIDALSGAELVRGFDHDRDALRSFRLDRIVGLPSVAVAEYVQPVED